MGYLGKEHPTGCFILKTTNSMIPKKVTLNWLKYSKDILRVPVNSSNIRSIGYDETRQVMEIEFWSRGAFPPPIYRFGFITKEQHETLMKAESIGAHFNTVIKSNKAILNFKLPSRKTIAR